MNAHEQFHLAILRSRRLQHTGNRLESSEVIQRGQTIALIHGLVPNHTVCDALTENDLGHQDSSELIFQELLVVGIEREFSHYWIGTKKMREELFDEGLEHLTKALDLCRQLPQSDPMRLLVHWTLNNLAAPFDTGEEYAEVCKLLRQALSEANDWHDMVHANGFLCDQDAQQLDVRYILRYGLGASLFLQGKPGTDLNREAMEVLSLAANSLEGNNIDPQARATIRRELGTVCYVEGDYEKAANCWAQSSEDYKSALTIGRMDKNKPAIVEDKAYALNQIVRSSASVKSRLEKRHSYILSYFPNRRTDALLGFSSSRERVFAETVRISQDIYERYARRRSDFGDEHLPELRVLRGWGSSMPLVQSQSLSGGEFNMTGGGYLFRAGGYGVAVDPGHDFLRNLHGDGGHIRDIAGVYVSHNHSDHNADIFRIDDLRYELFNREINSPESLLFDWVLDEETRSIVQQRYRDNRSSWSDSMRNRIRLPNGESGFDSLKLKNGPRVSWTISTQTVFHGEIYGPMCGRFEHKALTIAYTGDMSAKESKYRSPLDFSKAVTLLSGAQILIAHMSQPDKGDYLEAEYLKDVHLGLNGTIAIARKTRPQILLIGEFWGGLGDFRIQLINLLQSELDALEGDIGHRILVLPAGLGLRIQLEEKALESRVKCSRCAGWVEISRVSISRKGDYFSPLQFLCEQCDAGAFGKPDRIEPFLPNTTS